MRVLYSVIIASLLMLFGCGDSGSFSSDNNEISSEVKIGLFVDSQVSGVRYVSVSPSGVRKEGITSVNGEFEYFDGGTVSFFVGSIPIGTVEGSSIISSINLGSSEGEQTNIVRFLQTIDEDMDPSNGIQISNTVKQNAAYISNLDFKSESFETYFNIIKDDLFSGTDYQDRELVDPTAAIAHAEKSQRIANISTFQLGKAYSGQKTYSSNYNVALLNKSQKARIYLYIWQSELAPFYQIPISITSKMSGEIMAHDLISTSIGIVDTVTGIKGMSESYKVLKQKYMNRSMRWSILRATALTAEGCQTALTFSDTMGSAISATESGDFCTILESLNFHVGDVGSSVINEMLPKVLKEVAADRSFKILNNSLINENTDISFSAWTNVAKIINDTQTAYHVGNYTAEMTDYIIARLWLSYYFQAGFDKKFMSNSIEAGNYSLLDKESQIRAIAKQVALSTFWDDVLDYLGMNYQDSLNYNYDKVVEYISDGIVESNKRYQKYNSLIGPFSNENSQIGLLELIDLEDSQNNVPEITNSPATEVELGNTYNYVPVATDSDGDQLTYSITNKPSWATFDTTTGQLTGTPTSTGTYSNITITVSDGVGGADSVTFSIIINSSPLGISEFISAIKNDVIAYYPLNGSAVETYNGLNGNIVGNVSFTKDRFGNENSAASFPGISFNYINVPYDTMLCNNELTLSAWGYAVNPSGDLFLINKGRDIVNGSYRLLANSAGFQVAYSGTNGAGTNTRPEANVWHMYVGTVSGNEARLYIDGVLVDTKFLTYNFSCNPGDSLALGMHYYTGVPSNWTYPFNGRIDDVVILKRALTGTEVNAFYNASR